MLEKWLIDWNKKIQEWDKAPQEYFKNDIFSRIYAGKNHQALVPNALPEPYFGDPLKNSCVILNLNPGGVMPEIQDRLEGTFIKKGKAILNYREFATAFPYLYSFSDNAGGNWWHHRNEWINRLIKLKTGKGSSLKPFALEICYWHSKSWAKLNLKKDEASQYLIELFKIAEEANKHSELKIITSVGKLYCKIFEQLGYQKLVEINNKNFQDFGLSFPRNKDTKAKDRTFSLYRSPSGSLYYNTWHTGGNKQPTTEWLEIEKFVLSYQN